MLVFAQRSAGCGPGKFGILEIVFDEKFLKFGIPRILENLGIFEIIFDEQLSIFGIPRILEFLRLFLVKNSRNLNWNSKKFGILEIWNSRNYFWWKILEIWNSKNFGILGTPDSRNFKNLGILEIIFEEKFSRFGIPRILEFQESEFQEFLEFQDSWSSISRDCFRWKILEIWNSSI